MIYRFSSLSFVLVAIIMSVANAQEWRYPIPRNWQKAIEKQTRTLKGEPGNKYWQNKAKYVLEAKLSIKKRYLKGQGTITYYNNSPDTLDRLVFNLYQDIFRKGNSRDWDVGTSDLHDGTKIRRLSWNGKKIDPNNPREVYRTGTKLVVRPGIKILPGDSVLIETAWELPIPEKRTVRMGKYSDSVVFIAYWYPQIAVYDDIDGWDMINYGGSVEFYNDFNDYDIKISLPRPYVVWATGNMVNQTRIFSTEIIERLRNVNNDGQIVRIIGQSDYQQKRVFRRNAEKIFHFQAYNVPDFSFGAGRGLIWDATTVRIDHHDNRVLASAVYPIGAKHWDKVAHFSQLSISYMSRQMPGIPFPYPHMTTMHNGKSSGGMETPMMAINGAPSNQSGTFSLTFHEIAHTYFPFFMGTNEKKYAWMDEGWATLWPYRLSDSLFQERNYIAQLISNYEQMAGTENDLPPMIPNQFMAADYPSLRLATYVRPALAYYFLEQALGAKTFKKALHHYMHTWNGKHPIPIDFFACFEQVADASLQWFFRPWFYSFAYPDLALRKLTSDHELVIENVGGLPLPLHISVKFADDTSEIIDLNANVWSSGEHTILVPLSHKKPVREVTLGSPLIPDVQKQNNKLLFID